MWFLILDFKRMQSWKISLASIYPIALRTINEQNNCTVLNTSCRRTEKILECWHSHVQCRVLEQTKQVFDKEKSVVTTDS